MTVVDYNSQMMPASILCTSTITGYSMSHRNSVLRLQTTPQPLHEELPRGQTRIVISKGKWTAK